MSEIKYQVRCHEWGDGSDYLMETFDTEQEAQEYIDKRDREHPGDGHYEHWYITSVDAKEEIDTMDKLEKKLKEVGIDKSVLTNEEIEALKEEIEMEEKGAHFLDGVLSNPEIYFRKLKKQTVSI